VFEKFGSSLISESRIRGRRSILESIALVLPVHNEKTLGYELNS
jgi:hypothetical protein